MPITDRTAMAVLIAEHDWSATPLGPIEAWPQSLKTAVDIMLGSGHAMQIAWGPERTILYNDAYAPMLGDRHPGVLGLPFCQAWGDVWYRLEPLVERAFAGETVRLQRWPLTYARHGEPEDSWWDFSYSPVHLETGAVGGLLNVCAETTDRVRAEDVEARRIDSERFSRALVEGVPQLVWRAVDGGEWTWASPQWTEFTGQTEDASHGYGWLDPVHPDDRAETMERWHGATDRGYYEADYRIRHALDGGYRWFQTRASPVRNAAGDVVEWLGTSTDVDDLRQLQDRQHVLVAELQHRVRNILAVVRAVLNRTLEADGPMPEKIDHFRGRLDSLARTQVISTGNVEGYVDLHTMIYDELMSVGAANSPTVSLDGPDVSLNGDMAETLGLALHELTTNALKYGALKVKGGSLDIRWESVDDGARRLDLTWTERGVPALEPSPSRRGFGRELIEQALPYRLGASSQLEFRGGGVRCALSIPLPAR